MGVRWLYLPTCLTLSGLFAFQAALLVHRPTWMLPVFVALSALFCLWITQAPAGPRVTFPKLPLWLVPGVLTLLAVLLLSLLNASYPPNLPQEYDAINYHMGLTRQHLLTGSLSHIAWSTADLFPSPIQWGFAPMWFGLPGVFHSIPQWLCLVFVFLIMTDLGARLADRQWTGWIPVLALLTTHGVVIQSGTAMMDIPNLFFLLAATHAALVGNGVFFVLNGAFFFWSKSFSPFQACAVLLAAWFGLKALRLATPRFA